MTGCYANRVGMAGALNPTSTTGIHQEELLLPEILQSKGYATAIYGKWHLGNQSQFNPLSNGFDEYYGIPFSNDNHNKYHPVIRTFPPLPMYEGYQVVEEDPDQSLFTRRFTERAIQFIEKHKDQPFFLYVPHVMPHVPIFASEDFLGSSGSGLYGDVIEELDWSVGEIVATLQKHNLEKKTLVIFTSDNGPFLSYGEHAGSSGPLRGGKLTTFEGGVRVPCIMSWPGTLPEGSTCNTMLSTLDWLPTIAHLVEAQLPQQKIDGKDIWPWISSPANPLSPREAFYYYAGKELHAVRAGKWKLHFPHPYLEVDGEPGKDRKPANFENLSPKSITESGLKGIASRHGYRIRETGLELYNLEEDLAEQINVAENNPEVVERLKALAEKAREDLGDALTGREGKNIRPTGVATAQANSE
jgi:arylsulfatase